MPVPDSPVAAGQVLPLHGLTILAVEDSRHACDALRLLVRRSGARMRRAGTLAEARRHLALYRPDVAIVDIGLPDGSGLALIGELAGTGRPVVIASSGDDSAREKAMAAGAADWLPKPVAGLAAFRSLLLRHLPGPPVSAGETGAGTQRPDPLALHDDLMRAARVLAAEPVGEERLWLGRFLGGVARCARDAPLERAAGALAAGEAGARKRAGALVARRLRHAPAPFAAPPGR